MNELRPTIAIKFEGVISENGSLHAERFLTGLPNEGAMNALENLSSKYRIMILTSRQPSGFPFIEDWMRRNRGNRLFTFEITNTLPVAAYYIDNRAIKYENWSQVLNLLGS